MTSWIRAVCIALLLLVQIPGNLLGLVVALVEFVIVAPIYFGRLLGKTWLTRAVKWIDFRNLNGRS